VSYLFRCNCVRCLFRE